MGREYSLKSFYNFFREKVSINKSSSKTKGISIKNMTNNNKPIRLSKAAREFNVSIGTIVDYLTKKGHELSSNPNTKLSPEMYELLLKEYSREKSVKEEAKRHSLKYNKRRSISLEDEQKEKEEEEVEEVELPEEDEEEEDTVFIKNASGWSSGETETPEKEEEKKQEEPEKEEPAAKEEPSEKKEPEEAPSKKEETQAEEEKPAEEKPAAGEKPSEEKPPEEKPEEKGPKVLGKIELDTVEKKKTKPSTKKDEPKAKEEKQEEKETKKQKAKAPAAKKEKPAEKATEKAAEEKPPKEEATPAKAEKKVEDQPKKVEKQPEAAEEKQKAQKPEKEEPKKEKAAAAQKEKEQKAEKEPAKEEAKQKEEAPAKEESKEKEDTDFIKTKVEKLKGPNILGSIELPEKQKKPEKKRPDQKRRDRNKKAAESKGKAKETDSQKKKPVASSTDDNVRPKKKKRRRIATGSESAQDKQNTSQRPQKGARPTKKTSNKKPAASRHRHEPSEEEVQKQVKETLARLSGGGKSKSAKHRRSKRDTVKTQQENEGNNQEKKILQATEFVTVNELASMMEVNVNQVISTCMSLGLFVSINQRLDAETINMVADEFGYDVEFVSVEVQEALESHEKDEEEGEQVERAPIVTVMGHVDHGKTSLLDFIRKTNVIGGEAGGITQHIGAYEVKTQSGKRITFLDTPGHEAFTAMRARGAQVTDVAIIIIAADDKIMPQTIEAINHAQAAGVPTVFAINKVDKPGASPDKIKEELSQRNILVEEWGGKYQSQDISALKGKGIEDLLEKVLLESELLELKGSPEKMARGTVIESALDRGRGYIAKLLVQDGTLNKGDYVLAGAHSGKVKAMYNERNQVVDEAGPSSPVLMLGLDGAPQAGDQFNVLKDEREAKEIALKRRQLQREQGIRTQKHVTLDEIGRRIAIGDFKELNVIVKGDVDGSVEALADSLLKQTTEEVQLNVIHKSVGQISESDVMLASASDAIIVGFQVRPSLAARRLAEREQIDIRVYSVIYKAIEEIKSAMEGMLSPEIEEKIVCNLEVRETFKITKVGTIAGCKVLDGVITRNTKVRVIRDGIVIYTGTLGSLKRYKDDVKEVKAGYECGLNIENFNDIKVGDIIEGYEQVEVARKL